MSTKENNNTFEIGELVRLKFTHSVGIVVEERYTGEHHYSYKVKWQPRSRQVTPSRQWYPAQELATPIVIKE